MLLHLSYLLFLISFFLSLTGVLPIPGCQTQCGQIDIPRPFGIGPGCYDDESFNVTCVPSGASPELFLNNRNQSKVIGFQVKDSIVRIEYPYVAGSCFSTKEFDGDHAHPLENYYVNVNLSSTPFSLSDQNIITIVGCDDFVNIHGINSEVFSGCTSICVNREGNGTCPDDTSSKNGCCRFPIPKGTKQLSFEFTDMHEHSRKDTMKRLYSCSYAYIGENKGKFSYYLRGLNNYTKFLKDNPGVTSGPLVLDWWVKNPTCSTNMNNCSCDQPFKQEGYKCRCKKGYEGNAYVPDGCTDIDECADNGKHKCISSRHCKNTLGNYTCFCPNGYEGDGRKGCYPSKTLKYALTGVGGGLGLVFLLLICYWLYVLFVRRIDTGRKKRFFKCNGGLLLQQQASGGMTRNMNLFTSNELQKATDHFNVKRILGQGGHGTVYKGILSDGSIVAIKKAKLIDDNEKEQFINEMVILSQINHKHVVKLLGCCLETEVPLLVYEFISSGTLFDLIHDESVEITVTWDMRLKIASDVAGAISYLHSASSIPIIHRDIKSNNILMDGKHVAKISDFGTSRLVSVDKTHLTTHIAGTFGYMDPEYYQTSQLTDKSDVYSFGVVLVELLTGKMPISSNRVHEEERSLATHFLISMANENIESILDVEVFRGCKDDVMEVAKLAKRCLNLKRKLRPTMTFVAMELERIRKSRMPQSPAGTEEDDDFEDLVRGHKSKMMTLSSYDYSWTWNSGESVPSSPAANHPLIN